MLKIDSEYNRVKSLSAKIGRKFLTSNCFKEDREIYILGTFVELLKIGGYNSPEYFLKYKDLVPDFKTYSSNKNFFKKIEIVQNLHWGRKIGNEEKIPFDRSKYTDASNRCQIRVWYSFIKNLNKKFSKFYGNDSWLVMYHNISVYHISDISFWPNIIFSMKDQIEKRELVNFSKSTYEKIFVLNSGFTELVQIFPDNEVIFSSEYEQYLIK